MPDVNTVLSRFSDIRTIRQQWEGEWYQVVNQVLPFNNVTLSETGGIRKTPSSTGKARETVQQYGIQALTDMAAGMVGTITPPNSKWFDAQMVDREMAEMDSNREPLERLVDRMHLELLRAGFYTQFDMFMREMGVYGFGVMWVGKGKRRPLKLQTYPSLECYIDEDEEGDVDTVYRRYNWSGKQILQAYGGPDGPLNREQKEILMDDPTRLHELLHAVEPRVMRDPTKGDNLNMPFAGYFIWPEQELLLDETGYNEFPYVVDRWITNAGQLYGFSPSMTTYKLLRMVDKIEVSIIKGVNKLVDPQLLVPDDAVIKSSHWGPGGNIVYRSGTSEPPREFQTSARPDWGRAQVNEIMEAVRSAFYLDVLSPQGETTSPGKSPYTATEISRRGTQGAIKLIPMITRMQHEMLMPLLQRTFAVLDRGGHLREIMDQFVGDGSGEERRVPVDFAFISPAFISMRSSEIEMIRNFMQDFIALAQTDRSGEVMASLDHAELMKHLGTKVYNITASAFPSEEEVQARVERARQAQRAEMQRQQAETMSQITTAQARLTGAQDGGAR